MAKFGKKIANTVKKAVNNVVNKTARIVSRDILDDALGFNNAQNVIMGSQRNYQSQYPGASKAAQESILNTALAVKMNRQQSVGSQMNQASGAGQFSESNIGMQQSNTGFNQSNVGLNQSNDLTEERKKKMR